MCMVSMNLGKYVLASASKCAFEGGIPRGVAAVGDSPRSGPLPRCGLGDPSVSTVHMPTLREVGNRFSFLGWGGLQVLGKAFQISSPVSCANEDLDAGQNPWVPKLGHQQQ